MGETSTTASQSYNRAAFDRWAAFCTSRRGERFMFVWAVAEATVWPVIPDGLLLPMALARRERYWRLWLSAILGSTIGGIALYLFAYFLPDAARSLLSRLPAVHDFMIAKVDAALSAQGVFAFWTQPWSGVSFKIFAVEAGARGLSPLQALPISIAARGLRMFAVASVAHSLARLFPKFFRDFWLYVLVSYSVLFTYVWLTTQLIP